MVRKYAGRRGFARKRQRPILRSAILGLCAEIAAAQTKSKKADFNEKIDFHQKEKFAPTIFATTWELSKLPTPARVDKLLPASVAGN